MGRKVDYLANTPVYYNAVQEVAKQQFSRRNRAYKALAIFTSRDLSQEIWCSLLEREAEELLVDIFLSTVDDFKDYCKAIAEIIAVKGRRKLRQLGENMVSDIGIIADLDSDIAEQVEKELYSY